MYLDERVNIIKPFLNDFVRWFFNSNRFNWFKNNWIELTISVLEAGNTLFSEGIVWHITYWGFINSDNASWSNCFRYFSHKYWSQEVVTCNKLSNLSNQFQFLLLLTALAVLCMLQIELDVHCCSVLKSLVEYRVQLPTINRIYTASILLHW